ncbi:hypothetical protein RRG08_014629 [Elysia crispata]|uniref:Uncharacterized protein n=1 Tax=Elysia crispata TaxID=231223 RepID=A0AAE0YSU6_9GAST|nr:hypothetical protein RRG08_014629 [Elysia crispata]
MRRRPLVLCDDEATNSMERARLETGKLRPSSRRHIRARGWSGHAPQQTIGPLVYIIHGQELASPGAWLWPLEAGSLRYKLRVLASCIIHSRQSLVHAQSRLSMPSQSTAAVAIKTQSSPTTQHLLYHQHNSHYQLDYTIIYTASIIDMFMNASSTTTTTCASLADLWPLMTFSITGVHDLSTDAGSRDSLYTTL